MALAKLQITVVHTGASFTVQFNPEEYSLNQENNFASQAIPGLSGPLLQFVAGNASTLDMELFFDTWDSGSLAKRDVRDEVRKVTDLLKIDRDLHAPPVLDVEWGSLSFRCVLKSARQQFQMFADDGRPVRAKVTVSFTRYIDAAFEAKEINRQTADFSKVHVVSEGENLSAIAFEHYEDPRQWRPIAIANGLLDPRELAAGTPLRIPALPYLHPDTGEVVR
jgi:hypothetical protein